MSQRSYEPGAACAAGSEQPGTRAGADARDGGLAATHRPPDGQLRAGGAGVARGRAPAGRAERAGCASPGHPPAAGSSLPTLVVVITLPIILRMGGCLRAHACGERASVLMLSAGKASETRQLLWVRTRRTPCCPPAACVRAGRRRAGASTAARTAGSPRTRRPRRPRAARRWPARPRRWWRPRGARSRRRPRAPRPPSPRSPPHRERSPGPTRSARPRMPCSRRCGARSRPPLLPPTLQVPPSPSRSRRWSARRGRHAHAWRQERRVAARVGEVRSPCVLRACTAAPVLEA